MIITPIILFTLLFCPTLFAAEQVFTQQTSVLPEFAISGDKHVGVKTIEVSNPNALNLTDFVSKTDRKLILEVWYPAVESANKEPLATYKAVTRLHKPFELVGLAHRNVKPHAEDKFPLVVISHGYTGYRSMMFYLGEHLASYGYIVIAIDHTDSTTGEIDLVNAPNAGFVSTLINRAKDQQFVLEAAMNKDFFLNDIIDKNNAAVIGYSMGGYGAINTVGGCYDAKAENLVRLGFPEQAASALLPVFNFCNAGRANPDKRWKAMIGFAPWGQEFNIHQPEALAKLSVPTLFVSGDEDDVSGFSQGVEKLFKQTSPADNYLLVFENARHNIAPHPAPSVAYETDEDLGHYFEPSWSAEQLTRINEHMSLVFLNCYVKQQESACDYLPKRVDAAQIKKADGTLTSPWPGFKSRWATGMRFYRAVPAD